MTLDVGAPLSPNKQTNSCRPDDLTLPTRRRHVALVPSICRLLWSPPVLVTTSRCAGTEPGPSVVVAAGTRRLADNCGLSTDTD